MAWYVVLLTVSTVIAIPQVIGLLIVALAPSRSEHVCQVLREGSRVNCFIAARRQSRAQGCSCATHWHSSLGSRKES
jgi:hypothetical protein